MPSKSATSDTKTENQRLFLVEKVHVYMIVSSFHHLKTSCCRVIISTSNQIINQTNNKYLLLKNSTFTPSASASYPSSIYIYI